MDDSPYYCTTEALEEMRRELAHLRGPARDELRRAFEEAQGEETELEENTAYQFALMELAVLEQRIATLADMEARAQVHQGAAGEVTAGALVTVLVREPGASRGRREKYLVDSALRNGVPDDVAVVSPTSPMGRVLLGTKVGDALRWSAPVGEFTGKVVEVRDGA